eukprot:1676961-Pyramimonas_sp.AAC.1
MYYWFASLSHLSGRQLAIGGSFHYCAFGFTLRTGLHECPHFHCPCVDLPHVSSSAHLHAAVLLLHWTRVPLLS